MSDRITPHLWFDGNAEQAAAFYTRLIPNSQITNIHRAASDNPSTRKGDPLVVEFSLDGRPYAGLNGGPQFSFSEAISLATDCADQAEVDHYWNALIAEGGTESHCGWCKDRFGLSWQVAPRQLKQMLSSQDRAATERAMRSMLSMKKLNIADLASAYQGT